MPNTVSAASIGEYAALIRWGLSHPKEYSDIMAELDDLAAVRKKYPIDRWREAILEAKPVWHRAVDTASAIVVDFPDVFGFAVDEAAATTLAADAAAAGFDLAKLIQYAPQLMQIITLLRTIFGSLKGA